MNAFVVASALTFALFSVVLVAERIDQAPSYTFVGAFVPIFLYLGFLILYSFWPVFRLAQRREPHSIHFGLLFANVVPLTFLLLGFILLGIQLDHSGWHHLWPWISFFFASVLIVLFLWRVVSLVYWLSTQQYLAFSKLLVHDWFGKIEHPFCFVGYHRTAFPEMLVNVSLLLIVGALVAVAILVCFLGRGLISLDAFLIPVWIGIAFAFIVAVTGMYIEYRKQDVQTQRTYAWCMLIATVSIALSFLFLSLRAFDEAHITLIPIYVGISIVIIVLIVYGCLTKRVPTTEAETSFL